MIIGKEDWIIKLGPFTRVNTAETRKQSSEGAIRKIMEDSVELMKKAKVLIPELAKDSACASGGDPEVKEEHVKPQVYTYQVYTYQVADKKWFSLATSGSFGIKLTCKG